MDLIRKAESRRNIAILRLPELGSLSSDLSGIGAARRDAVGSLPASSCGAGLTSQRKPIERLRRGVAFHSSCANAE